MAFRMTTTRSARIPASCTRCPCRSDTATTRRAPRMKSLSMASFTRTRKEAPVHPWATAICGTPARRAARNPTRSVL